MNHIPLGDLMPGRTTATARHGVVADLDATASAYGTAIVDEAVASWTLPDERRRRELSRNPGFTTYLRGMLAAGTVVVGVADGIAGVSAWLAGGGAADDTHQVDAEVLVALREVYGGYTERVLRLGELTGQWRPTREQHLYLQQMAVVPAHRGHGIGGAMLEYGLALADARAVPTYLEASTPRNRELYLRHGFVDADEPIQVPDGGPRLQPMRRAPA